MARWSCWSVKNVLPSLFLSSTCVTSATNGHNSSISTCVMWFLNVFSGVFHDHHNCWGAFIHMCFQHFSNYISPSAQILHMMLERGSRSGKPCPVGVLYAVLKSHRLDSYSFLLSTFPAISTLVANFRRKRLRDPFQHLQSTVAGVVG